MKRECTIYNITKEYKEKMISWGWKFVSEKPCKKKWGYEEYETETLFEFELDVEKELNQKV